MANQDLRKVASGRQVMAWLVCVVSLWLSVFTVAQAGAVMYVDINRPGGDGSTWASAYKTLDAAVANAHDNEEIWVSKGTYAPAATLNLKKGVRVYGGFSGVETLLSQRNFVANVVVIDGALTLRHLFYFDLADGVRIDGVTITRGNARPGTPGTWDEFGGGVCFARSNQVVIANCIFLNNKATQGGGALLMRLASATVENCRFEGNAASSGGALGVSEADILVNGCYFGGNTASFGDKRGGAISTYLRSPRVVNSTFSGNSSAHMGGAVEFIRPQGASVEGCVFTGNTTVNGGGAIESLGADLDTPASWFSVTGSSFTANSSNLEGGAIYSYYSQATVSQSTFTQNTAANGGGIMLDYNNNKTALVSQCSFFANTASSEGGAIDSYARNIQIDSSVFTGNVALTGGAVRFHGGEGGTANPGFVGTIRNSSLYGNRATGHGGGLCNSFVPMAYLYNTIFWGNQAQILIWDDVAKKMITTPDIFNAGSSSITMRYNDIQTLSAYRGSVSESTLGDFSLDPKFVDANGADNIVGTGDDNLRLQLSSPCIDRADGSNAPAVDIVGTPRCDEPSVGNGGGGTPPYADVGAYERLVVVATPTISPGSGPYNSSILVTLSSGTSGATIRYTTNGSEPTASSPAASSLTLIRGAVVKAKAFKSGMMESGVATATYTMPDTDQDGLPNWVETNTGTYVSKSNTGSNPNKKDSDGDGWTDGVEVDRGTDPNDPGSFPRPKNDFDGDGKADLSIYHRAAGNWYIKYSGGGDLPGFNMGWSEAAPVPGDYDGDGKTDLAVYYQAAGMWFVKYSGGGDLPGYQMGWNAAVPVPADYDGDGKTDLAVYHPAAGRWYIKYSGGGDLPGYQMGWSAATPVPGDYDGDGKADLALYHQAAGNWYILYSGGGNLPGYNMGWSEAVPVPADYDGDGKTDLAVYHPATGRWYIKYSGGGDLPGYQMGWSAALPVPADYDGDGRADLAVYHPESGRWYIKYSGGGDLPGYQMGWGAALPVGFGY